MEVPIQKWPFEAITYLNVEHFHPLPRRKDPSQTWEYLTVEAVFPAVAQDVVMFFDHYTNEYKSQRSELDAYLEKLGVDGWMLTIAGPVFEGNAYKFRRIQFRRFLDRSE